ncbi:MAG: septation protein SepH, partial [Microbacterium sp.]
MEQLKVIGTEDEVLVLATESGETFSLAVDDALRAELRRSRRDRDGDSRAERPSPREIQSHIRAGLSADEVATLLGARVEDVARFEGPVLAEREHVVGQALAVPVLLGADLDGHTHPTFGGAVRAKLAEAGATGERWTSWKEPTGWVVKLEFTAKDVGHDARWGFDPKRSTLSPLNADAIQLSRQGSLPEGLIPRLRA